jgi:hypothetical protein
MNTFLQFIYGIVILVLLYFFIRMLYSVYYTPGTTVIYNSPQAQQLYPGDNKKLYPLWGYNRAGMYDGQKFKFGAGSFYPESGAGYVPNKFGSPGASPSGGMRPHFPIPAQTAVGFWGFTPRTEQKIELNIYDHGDQHVEYVTPIGWWGY